MSAYSNFQYFSPEKCISLKLQNYAVLILNQPIFHPRKFLVPFWNNATIKITVDGGTNRWFDYINEDKDKNDILPPDVVSGDFDSVHKENLKTAEAAGAKIITTENQDETDFTKALRVLSEECSQRNVKVDKVFVVCQSSGRIDQIISNINTLYNIENLNIFKEPVTICLFSSDSFTWLLQPGKHTIEVANALKTSKNAWCGLIPIGKKCEDVTTTGLKWNLDHGQLAFGTLVSTSNTYDGSDFVTIDTDSQLIWCMGLLPIFASVFGTLDKEQ